MAWVRSEYAGEFAVLSAWLSMVLPWNLVYNGSVPTSPLASEMAIIRLSIVEIQFRFPAVATVTAPDGSVSETSAAPLLNELFPGVNVVSEVYVTSPVGASAHYDGLLQLGSLAWAVGALALLSAFAVSLGLYFREEAFEAAIPEDPVRLIGGLLGVAALATATASVLYFFERDLVGFPVPIGVLVMGALSVALLRVERR